MHEKTMRAILADGLAQPAGYHVAGLVPRSLVLPRWTVASSTQKLARRIEAFEHTHANPLFQARHFDRVGSPFAFELANTYVALREQYPPVRPDLLDLAAPFVQKMNLAGWSCAYPVWAPASSRAARTHGLSSFADLLASLMTMDVDLDVVHADRSTLGGHLGTRDLTSSGIICLAPRLTRPTVVRDWASYLPASVKRSAAVGCAPARPALRISFTSMLMIHEFGHLLDGELLALGQEPAEYVYGELSAALWGCDRPVPEQWATHLLNVHGKHSSLVAGRHAGGAGRQRVLRRTVLEPLAFQLGRRARMNRDELFAESFALAYAAQDPELRSRLARLLVALTDVGLMATPV